MSYCACELAPWNFYLKLEAIDKNNLNSEILLIIWHRSDILYLFENPWCLFQDNRVHIGPKIEMRVVALGLDGAGKTSILFKLKQNEFMSVTPTIG